MPNSISYEVREDPRERGRWNVLRNGVETGGYGRSIHMAVGSAIGLAQQEARETGTKTKVVSIVGQKRTEEWKSP